MGARGSQRHFGVTVSMPGRPPLTGDGQKPLKNTTRLWEHLPLRTDLSLGDALTRLLRGNSSERQMRHKLHIEYVRLEA